MHPIHPEKIHSFLYLELKKENRDVVTRNNARKKDRKKENDDDDRIFVFYHDHQSVVVPFFDRVVGKEDKNDEDKNDFERFDGTIPKSFGEEEKSDVSCATTRRSAIRRRARCGDRG